ncbi:MAG: SAM-dependent methyltransferase [Desulfobacterales bacterium]|nr:SAM-dependent methyltransferase [Desulfobacterales bacterium]
MEITFTPIGVMHLRTDRTGGSAQVLHRVPCQGHHRDLLPVRRGAHQSRGIRPHQWSSFTSTAPGDTTSSRNAGALENCGAFSACARRTGPTASGMSILKLLKMEGNMLHVENVDMLDGTPILDIKPYKPHGLPTTGEG